MPTGALPNLTVRYYVIEENVLKASGRAYTWAIEQDERSSYLFSLKDICMIEHIPALIRPV